MVLSPQGRCSLGVAFAVFTLLSLALRCSEPKTRGPSEEEDGELAPGISPGSPTLFPHAADWASPASHGPAALYFGTAACLQCHKKISTEPEPAPTCHSCHPLYPHLTATEWVKKESHGNAFLVKGRPACATLCHGYDLAGGLSGVSCNLCHAGFPHTAAWVNPTEHGGAAKGDGKELCKGCHGSDLAGGSSGVSCNNCHKNYPHGGNWGEKEGHGEFVLDVGEVACATQCHGADLAGGLSEVSCHDCHELYPHGGAWESEHQAAAHSFGLDDCQGCHGIDLANVLDGKNCFSCHPDYPHPVEAVWLPYAGGHGERVREGYLDDTAECQKCHGVGLQTLKDGRNCFSCHPSYPHSLVLQDIDGLPPETPWRAYEAHGAWTFPRPRAQCTVCHGTAYDGGPRGNPSCTASACHANYPHEAVMGWRQDPGQPQLHGSYVQANGTASCATAHCHGVGLIPEPGVSHGFDCNTCHAAYPHVGGWIGGLVHGPAAIADITQCKSCHGPGLNVAPPGHQSCADCHPSYLQHPTAALGVIGWAGWSGHGILLLNPPYNGNLMECQLCHGGDYLGGISAVSCKDASCHPSFPHTDEDWPVREGHGDYVHDTLPVVEDHPDFTSCKLCHGNDLAGGHSGQSCISGCHPDPGHINYPHTVIANWDTSGHGTASVAPEDRAQCGNCHGEALDGGEAGVSCTTCHTNFPHPAAADWTELWSSFEEVCDEDPDWGDCWQQEVVHVSPHAQQFFNQKDAGFPPSFDNCSNCHGGGYAGGNSGVPCGTCHDGDHAGYPHIADPNWRVGVLGGEGAGGNHTTAFLVGAPDLESPCTLCHSGQVSPSIDDLGAGPEGRAPSCLSCHVKYPHFTPPQVPAADDWMLSSKHGIQAILAEMTSSPTTCRSCHGADLLGEGVEAKDCAGCHDHYGSVSHYGCCEIGGNPDGSWRLPSHHGTTYLLAKIEGDPARCTGCHSLVPRDPPTVCNPFDYQDLVADEIAPTPADWLTWCSVCHTLPGGVCPVDGCATIDPDDEANGDCP